MVSRPVSAVFLSAVVRYDSVSIWCVEHGNRASVHLLNVGVRDNAVSRRYRVGSNRTVENDLPRRVSVLCGGSQYLVRVRLRSVVFISSINGRNDGGA